MTDMDARSSRMAREVKEEAADTGSEEDACREPAGTSEPLVLSILIPAYNEVESITQTVDRMLSASRELPVKSEIIVVDDGSTDGTLELLAKFGSHLTIARHRRNRGYGAALKTGIEIANGDWIAIADADGTYPLERLPDLWERCATGLDMVVAARTEPGAEIPLARRPAKWLLRRFASWLAGYKIIDLNSGFRIFRRATVVKFLPLLPDGFSLTSTVTMAFLSDGRTVEYVPITYAQRTGRSKIRPIHDTYQFFMLVLRTSLFFAPLRFFFPLGFSFMLLSFLLVAYRAVVGEAFGVVSVILFVSGIQLLALGLLADLLNRKFEGLGQSR